MQRLADLLESANAAAKSRQFFQGSVRAAPAVKKAIDLVHDVAQGAKLGLAPGNSHKSSLLRRSEAISDKEVTMVKEVCDFLLESFLAAGVALLRLRGRTTAGQLGHLRPQRPAHLGHRLEHGFCQLRDDVEFTYLMRDRTEDFSDRDPIERRGVCGDAMEFQAPGGKGFLKPSEEPQDIRMLGIVVQDFIDETPEGSIVNDRKHAKGTVVQFVRGNIPGEVRQRLVEVFGCDIRFSLFSPQPPPSFEWWRREQRPDDRATNARKPPGKAIRPPRPAGPPEPRPCGCSGISAERDHPCRR